MAISSDVENLNFYYDQLKLKTTERESLNSEIVNLKNIVRGLEGIEEIRKSAAESIQCVPEILKTEIADLEVK